MDCFFACLLDYDLLDCDLYLIVRLYGTCLYVYAYIYKYKFTCTRTLFSLREVHENMRAGLPRLHSSITVARFSIITRDLPHE